MFTSAFVVLALAASTFANVFVTQPIASTTCNGGQTCNVAWQDDGAAPALKDFGPSKVSVYVGNAQQQTMVQSITTSVDVSTTQAIQFTVDPNAGPNGNVYFIRFESLSLKDAKQPQFPALAFSAKFTLANMSGTFDPAVQAQIDGASTAPLATPSAPPSSGSSTGSSTGTSAKLTTSVSGSSTATSTSTARPTTTSASAAGRNLVAGGALSAVGVVAAFLAL